MEVTGGRSSMRLGRLSFLDEITLEILACLGRIVSAGKGESIAVCGRPQRDAEEGSAEGGWEHC